MDGLVLGGVLGGGGERSCVAIVQALQQFAHLIVLPARIVHNINSCCCALQPCWLSLAGYGRVYRGTWRGAKVAIKGAWWRDRGDVVKRCKATFRCSLDVARMAAAPRPPPALPALQWWPHTSMRATHTTSRASRCSGGLQRGMAVGCKGGFEEGAHPCIGVLHGRVAAGSDACWQPSATTQLRTRPPLQHEPVAPQPAAHLQNVRGAPAAGIHKHLAQQ